MTLGHIAEASEEHGMEQLADRTEAVLDRIDAATEWREHFGEHPWLMLGAAGVVGFVLGAALGPHEGDGDEQGRGAYAPSVGQLRPMLDDLAEALVGVASARVRHVISDMIPGFQEQLARIDERAGSR